MLLPGISELIGSGGKVYNSIVEELGVIEV